MIRPWKKLPFGLKVKLRNFESDCRRSLTRILYHSLRIRHRDRKRVAVMITDPRIFSLRSVIEDLKAKEGVELACIFATFNHGNREERAEDLSLTLSKSLENSGFTVLWAGSKSGCDAALAFLKRADLIVTSQPYVFPDRRLNSWNFPAKVLYVPYTLWSNSRLDLKDGEGISRCSGSAMLETTWHVLDFEARCPNSRLKGMHSGFPRLFELSLLDFRADSEEDTFRNISWSPHWSSLRSEDSAHVVSSFAVAIQDFLVADPSRTLVFRPHPLFDEYLSKFDFNRGTDRAIQALLSLENAERGDHISVEDFFQWTDVLIHNCGSFTSEFAITGKPVIFTKVPDDFIFENLSDFGSAVVQGNYTVESGTELLEILRSLADGLDLKLPLRQKVQELIRESIAINPHEIIAKEALRLLHA